MDASSGAIVVEPARFIELEIKFALWLSRSQRWDTSTETVQHIHEFLTRSKAAHDD